MRRAVFLLVLGLAATDGHAQSPSSQSNPVFVEEQALAAKVEARTHIKGFDLKTKAPKVRIDAGAGLSFYDMGTGNVVHEERWGRVPAPMQATFNQWAEYAGDQPSGQRLFGEMFHRFFLVHELGHWMEDQVMEQRRDTMAATARQNAKSARWEYETIANRISIAWWREHDAAYLAKLIKDFRAIQARLPNPVPAGEDARHYFFRQYSELAKDPNAYGWFQLHMVILAYDQQPRSSFQQAINTLPSENYDEHSSSCCGDRPRVEPGAAQRGSRAARPRPEE